MLAQPRLRGLRKHVWGRAHRLLYFVIGMLLMLALWIGLTQLVIWATNQINTVKYGYPRTYQVDAYVGHNESTGVPSHCIALNTGAIQ